MSITWNDAVTHCQAVADGAYLATTGRDGRPHVAWVGIGYDNHRLWTGTYRSSQKGRNLLGGSEVALHWPENPNALIFARANVRLVDTAAENQELWERGVLPYPNEQFWSSPEDPELLFVELTPYRVSVHQGDPSTPPSVWTPTGEGSQSSKAGETRDVTV